MIPRFLSALCPLLLLVLGLALAGGSGAAPAAAGIPCGDGPLDNGRHFVLGVNSAVDLTYQENVFPGEYDSPRRAGACWDRVTIHWSEVVAGKQAEQDALISAAQQSGLNVLLVLLPNHRPLTACAGTAYAGSSLPSDWPAWEQFVRDTLQRYDGDPLTGTEPAAPVERVGFYQLGGQVAVRNYWRDSQNCEVKDTPDEAAAERGATEFAELLLKTRAVFDEFTAGPQLGLGNIGEELMARKYFCETPSAGARLHLHTLNWPLGAAVPFIKHERRQNRASACADMFVVHELNSLLPLLEQDGTLLVDFLDIALYVPLLKLPQRVDWLRDELDGLWNNPVPPIWSTEYASPDLRWDHIPQPCDLACWERINAGDAIKRATTGMALDLGPMFVLRFREAPRVVLPNTSPAHRQSTPLRPDGSKRPSFNNLSLLGRLTNGYLAAREVSAPLSTGSVIEVRTANQKFVSAAWSETPTYVRVQFGGKAKVSVHDPRQNGAMKTIARSLQLDSQNRICVELTEQPLLIKSQGRSAKVAGITKITKLSGPCPT